jgi:hypothetical protein
LIALNLFMPALDVEPDRDPCSPLIEGNMSVGGFHTTGFRYYSIVMSLVFSLTAVLCVCAYSGVDPSPYAQYISGALLLVLGVFTTKKV